MKSIRITGVAFLLSAITALYCWGQTPTPLKSLKLIDQLVGKWQLSKVYDGDRETDSSKHKSAMREIEFTEQAKYISTTPKLDSGYFRTNEDHKRLYLENASTGQGSPKEWNIKIDNATLILSRNEPAKMKRYKYVYIRVPQEKAKR